MVGRPDPPVDDARAGAARKECARRRPARRPRRHLRAKRRAPPLWAGQPSPSSNSSSSSLAPSPSSSSLGASPILILPCFLSLPILRCRLRSPPSLGPSSSSSLGASPPVTLRRTTLWQAPGEPSIGDLRITYQTVEMPATDATCVGVQEGGTLRPYTRDDAAHILGQSAVAEETAGERSLASPSHPPLDASPLASPSHPPLAPSSLSPSLGLHPLPLSLPRQSSPRQTRRHSPICSTTSRR